MHRKEERRASLRFSHASQAQTGTCLEFGALTFALTCHLQPGWFPCAGGADVQLSKWNFSSFLSQCGRGGRDWKHSCSDNRLCETPRRPLPVIHSHESSTGRLHNSCCRTTRTSTWLHNLNEKQLCCHILNAECDDPQRGEGCPSGDMGRNTPQPGQDGFRTCSGPQTC